LNENQSHLLLLHVRDGASGTPEQLDMLTQQLRRAIGELPVESVDPFRERTGQAGQKAVDAVVIGALAVKILPQVVPVFCDLLKKWIGNSPKRQLTITVGGTKVEISGDLSSEQLAALVQSIARANTPAG
jgi:hypothetical protein